MRRTVVGAEPEAIRGIKLHAATERRRRLGSFDPFRTDVFALTDQIAAIASRHHVLTLDDVLDCLAEGRPFPPNAVHLSVDHGLSGTLVVAELLARYGLPWTLFVTVDAVVDGRTPWYVRLADAVAKTSNVLDGHGFVHDLSDTGGKGRFFALAAATVRIGGLDCDEAVDRILRLPGVAQGDGAPGSFLRTDEVEELARSGVAVGSASARDPELTQVDDDRLEAEVAASRARLETALGRPVSYFAYPHGRHDRRVRAEVRRHFDAAVGGPGALVSQDRFALVRRDAGHDRASLDAALGDARARPAAGWPGPVERLLAGHRKHAALLGGDQVHGAHLGGPPATAR